MGSGELGAIVGGAIAMAGSLGGVAWRLGKLDQSIRDLGRRVGRIEGGIDTERTRRDRGRA